MLDFIYNKTFILTALVAVIYVYIKYFIYNYWKRNGIAQEKPSLAFGNLPFSYFLGKISLGDIFKNSYKKFKHHPFFGHYVLFRPVIVINDPELIKSVLVRDFSNFTDHGWFANEEHDQLSGQLFLATGDKWANLRKRLSPIFTSGKIKQMYTLLVEISDEMIKTCNANLEESNILEVKDILARFTTDTISSIVYGFNCNSLENPDTEFRRYGMKALEFGSKLNQVLGAFIPEVLEKITKNFNDKGVQNFFINIFNDMVNYRRERKIVRKDFLNLLMQLVDRGEVEKDEETSNISNGKNKEITGKFTMDEAAAQAFVFFIGGFETASSTATYCLYELALNPEVQEKLQKEIDNVAESTDGLTSDKILEMEYLDMVFHETLRKHPSVPILNRVSLNDYKIPNFNYTIPKNMRVVIPVNGIQSDPQYYPDPDKFDPQRFSKENIASRINYTYIPFGEGPRICIGKRFGILQTKVAIVTMLRNYKFYICDKTPVPLKYSPDTFVQSPHGGIHLRVEKRK